MIPATRSGTCSADSWAQPRCMHVSYGPKRVEGVRPAARGVTAILLLANRKCRPRWPCQKKCCETVTVGHQRVHGVMAFVSVS